VQVIGPGGFGPDRRGGRARLVFAVDALTSSRALPPLRAADRCLGAPAAPPVPPRARGGGRAAWSLGWMRAGLSLTAVTVAGIATFLVLGPVISERD
jgi:hypothetical protein